jgi:hypothetical protein
VSERSLEAIAQAITAAGSCDKSMEVFEACSYAASGDVPLGEAVIKTCEGDFQAKLNAGQRKTYEQAIKGCWQKYRRESGTMYRSFEAMCAAAGNAFRANFCVRAPASQLDPARDTCHPRGAVPGWRQIPYISQLAVASDVITRNQ